MKQLYVGILIMCGLHMAAQAQESSYRSLSATLISAMQTGDQELFRTLYMDKEDYLMFQKMTVPRKFTKEEAKRRINVVDEQYHLAFVYPYNQQFKEAVNYMKQHAIVVNTDSISVEVEPFEPDMVQGPGVKVHKVFVRLNDEWNYSLEFYAQQYQQQYYLFKPGYTFRKIKEEKMAD